MSLLNLANEERGVADATVYSIRPLTEAETEAFLQAFAAKIGKDRLRIENIVDSNLLGGIKVRIGNRIYDGSFVASLNV